MAWINVSKKQKPSATFKKRKSRLSKGESQAEAQRAPRIKEGFLDIRTIMKYASLATGYK